MNIKDYFNSKSIGRNGPGKYALLGAMTCAVLLYAGTTPAIIALLPTIAYTVGKVNKWQEAAKGKAIWKPKVSDTFGL